MHMEVICHSPTATLISNSTPKSELSQLEKAFKTVQILDQKGIPLSRDIIYSILQECINYQHLLAGRRVHSLIITRGFDSVSCFSDHIIRLYAACGSLVEANNVFQNVISPTLHTWNVIITANVAFDKYDDALVFFSDLLQSGNPKPNKFTLSSVLKASSSLQDIALGRILYMYIVEESLECDTAIANTIVHMYANCGSINDAKKIFDGLTANSVVSWSSIIAGYGEQGDGMAAFDLFDQMQKQGLEPTRAVFLSILKACICMKNVIQGRKVHDQIIKNNLEDDVLIVSSLINMYTKSGSIEEADAVFKKSVTTDIVVWGALIDGYVENGFGSRALEAYKAMQPNIKPNAAIISSVLKACSSLKDIVQGIAVHNDIKIAEVENDVAVQTGLIDMYAKCGNLSKAWSVFNSSLVRDNVLWNAIIAAYVLHGQNDFALELFGRMLQEWMSPNVETYTSLLKACGNGSLYNGWILHDQIIRSGHDLEVIVGNAIVHMYANIGSLMEAHQVFDQLGDQNSMSWSILIAGYVHQELHLNALDLYNSMLKIDVIIDKATVSSVLKSCAGVGDLMTGKKLHDIALRDNFELDLIVNSSLVDMYAKCGNLGEARKVFDSSPHRDVASWGSIIANCCNHGNFSLADHYFAEMLKHGISPVSVIFSSMLIACSSYGLLERGFKILKSMRNVYGIVPDYEHYSCIVDLCSRSGHLSVAQDIIWSVPTHPDLIMKTSFLSGCGVHGNADMGKLFFKTVISPKDGSS